MGGRDQSERLVAINRNRWSQSAGARSETKNSPLLRIPRTLDIIGGGSTRMPELAAELVRRRVAVIATPGWPPAARAIFCGAEIGSPLQDGAYFVGCTPVQDFAGSS